MGALTIAGAALAIGGLSAVRNSTVGRYQQALGPTEPGYQASVVPTPTMGLLLRSGDGRLAGAAVLSLEPEDAGGTVALVPASIVVTDEAGAEHTLDEVYADRGAEAASQALGEVLTVAVDETVEVDEATWTQLVEPVGPVTVQLEDPVGEWAAGEVELQPSDVGRFLAARAADEPDLARVDRQQAFWDAWLPKVRDAGEAALPGEVETGVGRFVRAIAAGEGAAAAVPVGREDTADGVRYRPDPRRLGQFVSVTIPYPTSPAPGIRIRVRLLNGTDDPALDRAGRPCPGQERGRGLGRRQRRHVQRARDTLRARRTPRGPGPLVAAGPRVRPPRSGRRRAGWSDGDRRRHRRDRDPRPRCRGHSRGSRALTDRNDRASARDLAIAAARAADDKGARDIVVLEVGDVLVVADEFVIVSASNDRQVKAIVDDVERAVDAMGYGKPLRVEGLDDRHWVLMDYGDVIVHVFLEETRDYYELERLWSDVPRLEWAEVAASRPAGT